MTRTILIALDGSKLAEQVIPVVSAVAASTGSEVVLVSAVVPHDGWTEGPVAQGWEQEEQGAAASYLRLVRRQLQKPGLKVRAVRVESGHPHAVISAIADEEAADLIAMTTHGRSGFVRWVVGSVADKVLRTSRRPLLLVHMQKEGEIPEVRLNRILVPLDGSPLAESVLPFVEDLAVSLHASILLQSVIVPTATLYAGTLLPSMAPILTEIEEAMREYLGGVAKRLEHEGIRVETSVAIGYAAETILDAAKQGSVDLIALSTHGRSGPERSILGSVADAVVRHADRPCLVIPARGSHRVEEEPEPGEAGAPMAGTSIVPPPALTETPMDQERRRDRVPEERAHRPERSPGR